jgi:hypothetical protein
MQSSSKEDEIIAKAKFFSAELLPLIFRAADRNRVSTVELVMGAAWASRAMMQAIQEEAEEIGKDAVIEVPDLFELFICAFNQEINREVKP